MLRARVMPSARREARLSDELRAREVAAILATRRETWRGRVAEALSHGRVRWLRGVFGGLRASADDAAVRRAEDLLAVAVATPGMAGARVIAGIAHDVGDAAMLPLRPSVTPQCLGASLGRHQDQHVLHAVLADADGLDERVLWSWVQSDVVHRGRIAGRDVDALAARARRRGWVAGGLPLRRLPIEARFTVFTHPGEVASHVGPVPVRRDGASAPEVVEPLRSTVLPVCAGWAAESHGVGQRAAWRVDDRTISRGLLEAVGFAPFHDDCAGVVPPDHAVERMARAALGGGAYGGRICEAEAREAVFASLAWMVGLPETTGASTICQTAREAQWVSLAEAEHPGGDWHLGLAVLTPRGRFAVVEAFDQD